MKAGIQVDGSREISLGGTTVTHHSGKYHVRNTSFEKYSDLLEYLKSQCGISLEKRARTIYFKNGELYTKKSANINLDAKIVNTPGGWTIDSPMAEFPSGLYFKTEGEAIKHLTEKHPMFKLCNATKDELDNFIKTGNATFQCDMLNVNGVQNKVEVSTPKSLDKTLDVTKNSIQESLKMAGARQGSRAIASLMENVAETLLEKTGNSKFKSFLKTDLGKMILEIGSPIILHAALQHGLIGKSAYVEKLEIVTKLAIDANVNLYTMRYSDTAGDFVKNIFTDPKTRDNLKSIFALGSAFVSAESGDVGELNKFMLPMSNPLDSLLEEVSEKEQLSV